MAPEELLVSLVSELWMYVLILTPIASILSYIYMCGSNTDPDTQHWVKHKFIS